MGVIGVVVNIGMVVQVPRFAVDLVEAAPNVPIFAIVAVESADVESVDDPREAGALADRAVDVNPAGNVSFRGRVECYGLLLPSHRKRYVIVTSCCSSRAAKFPRRGTSA